MDFKKSLQDAWNIAQLNIKTMQKVAKDKQSIGAAVIIVLLAGAAMGIGSRELLAIIPFALFTIVGSFIGIGLLHLIAKLFGGKSDFLSFYKVLGHGYILQWVSVIPFLGSVLSAVAGIWQIIISYSALKELHKLSSAKAIIVILIPIIIGIILAALLGTAIYIAISQGNLPISEVY